MTSSSATSWGVPPAKLNIDSSDVHVWRATLDEPPAPIDCYLHTLAADERTRAERFYFRRDGQRFIIAHGVLRAILSLYLNESPKRISFCNGSHGKPALFPESGGDSIRFNMSHSHGMALYAVARSREVGVDIEFVRGDLEAEQIAERFFSRREIAELRALPAALRRNAFFLCWTRKEAYIKAKGEGLSLPLDQFDVSLTPGEPAALLNTRPDSGETLRWSLQELTPDPGYAAALAAGGHGWSLSCWQTGGLGQASH
ncbi:MAG: 4'-phosphopantetheinyl transferase superfamily protein [Candidatus Binataceae bacterium]